MICGQNRLTDGNWGVETGEQDQLRYMDAATAVLSVCTTCTVVVLPITVTATLLGHRSPSEAEREGKAATRRLPTSTFPVF